jgi:hypothetical protein
MRKWVGQRGPGSMPAGPQHGNPCYLRVWYRYQVCRVKLTHESLRYPRMSWYAAEDRISFVFSGKRPIHSFSRWRQYRMLSGHRIFDHEKITSKDLSIESVPVDLPSVSEHEWLLKDAAAYILSHMFSCCTQMLPVESGRNQLTRKTSVIVERERSNSLLTYQKSTEPTTGSRSDFFLRNVM